MSSGPRFVISCQSCSTEVHLWAAAEEHKKQTGHSDFFLHIDGDKR